MDTTYIRIIKSNQSTKIRTTQGETMTVTMLIGNTNNIPESITSTGNSMASIIANQFGEADGLRLSSLIAIGLVLFMITAIINMIGKIMIKRERIA